MHLHRKHSDDGRDSDLSAETLLNCDGSQLQETFKWKLQIFDDLKTKINGLNLDFDRKHQKLTGQIKELNDITDELESMHKKTKVGSLTGATIGAAGGITSIVGLALSPFTLGASLVLTVAGAAVGVAGGITSAASNITNSVKQKNLRETIGKITSDFINTINAMIENLSTINNSTEDIQQMVQLEMNYIPARMMVKDDGVGKVRDSSASTTLPEAQTPQKSQEAELLVKAVGWSKEAFKGYQVCSDIVKNIPSSTEIVKTARLSSDAAKTARLSSDAAKTVRLSSNAAKTARLSSNAAKTARLSSDAAKTARVSAQAAKAARLTLAVSGVVSTLSLALDVFCIVQDSIEISEINQSADNREAKNIKSETLKFIHQMRETAAQFQKTLDEIKDDRETANQEFEKELKNGISFLARQNDRDIANKQLKIQNRRNNRKVLFLKGIALISIVLVLIVLCFFGVTLINRN